MTWQRIDENTYIDDTLVTCAEYQLFIDEMRDQGKYYQPDHWTSYEFREGMALKPVLGTRHSDAVAFCEWLTKREDREWEYRLPMQFEVADLPANHPKQSSLGHWLNEENQFEWISSVPLDARKIVLSDIIDTLSAISVYDQSYIVAQAIKSSLGANSYNINKTINRALHTTPSFRTDLDRILHYSCVRAINFNIESKIVEELSLQHALERNLRRNLIHIQMMYGPGATMPRLKEEHMTIGYTRFIAVVIGMIPCYHCACMGFIDNFFSHYFRHIIGPDRALEILVDLFTLSERIAGRSPAFEGIRLVRGRIK